MTTQPVVVPAERPSPGSDARLIDESLFTSEGEMTLRGGRCPTCATTTFPAQRGCPRCGAQHMEPVALPSRGTLWSFTIQNFEPKAPYRGSGDFEPYGVGYIDLGDVIVESRLVENRPQDLVIDAAMSLVLVPAFADPDGTTVLTFAFQREATK